MGQTLFEAVRGRLLSLIPRFGLESSGASILEAYRLICGESLELPAGEQRPEMCRINRDGTAIQFSLALAHSRKPALQFLGEAGAPSLTGERRMIRNREAIRALADLMEAEGELDAISNLLQRMIPPSEAENNLGVYWIGVSFPPAKGPALTIYINSRLDGVHCQWERARAFTAFFGGLDTWRRMEPELRGHMTPLGMAMTIEAGCQTSGRVYFSAYGLAFDYYRDLMVKTYSDEGCGGLYDRYTEAMVGENRRYPARSAVCSVEFECGRQAPHFKFELCAHCAFSSDAEAFARCERWLESQQLDTGLYRDTIELLTYGQRLSDTTLPELHAYVGFGLRRGEAYATFYLNPGPTLA